MQYGARGRHGRLTAARFRSIRGALTLAISRCLLFAYAHLQTCLRSLNPPPPAMNLLPKNYWLKFSSKVALGPKVDITNRFLSLPDLKDQIV